MERPRKATSWSSADSASRSPPSAPRAIASSASPVERDAFRLRDRAQVVDDRGGADAAQVEALAARHDGRGDLLRLGRGEDELHVRRRLLEGLEQGVEGRDGEHVHFVDDVDLERAARGGVADVVAQVADLVHAVVGRAVDLQHVHAGAGRDLAAGVAGIAGGGGGPLPAVERLGEDPRYGRLADAPRADEQVGVRDPPALDGVAERAGHVVLPHHVAELPGPPFAGEDFVRGVRGRGLGGGRGGVAGGRRGRAGCLLPAGLAGGCHTSSARYGAAGRGVGLTWGRAPPFDVRSGRVPATRDSGQVDLRHPGDRAYRCYLPVLTGFTRPCRIGPSLQHHAPPHGRPSRSPAEGIPPCLSGLQVTPGKEGSRHR